jgi:damage-control phosphatase, subfamily I
MLIKSDCIPCILKMTVSAIRRLTDDEEIIREIISKSLQIPALQGLVWDRTSPEVIEPVMNLIMEHFKSSDPFQSLKREQNVIALRLYPHLKQQVQESPDPLLTAVHLAILGNSIDLMVSDRSIDPEKVLAEKLKQPIPEKNYPPFREKLGKTRLLVYLGDNAGEIVFDKILIETIRERYDLQIIFVVRGFPALNDVTIKEAREVGMDQVAEVIENGMKISLPGTLLSRCSPQFKELFGRADLVISKGGGNFDTLEGQKDLSKAITFMLLSKCFPYCDYFQVQMFQPILANFFTKHPLPNL